MNERQGKYRRNRVDTSTIGVGCLGGHLIPIPQMCSTNSLDASMLSKYTTFTNDNNDIDNDYHYSFLTTTHI